MSTCPKCGQEEPVNSERVRLERARTAVFEAWKVGDYADHIFAELKYWEFTAMVDAAIAAVRSADAESDALTAKSERSSGCDPR